MEIRLRDTGQVMFEGEFRAYQQTIGGPSWDQTTMEVLEALGADPVFEGPQATGGTQYQYSQRQGVEQGTDGNWYTKYVLGPIFVDQPATEFQPAKTAQELEQEYKARKDLEQASNIRNQRNQLLKDSDWTQVLDAPVDKQAWANYRQQLRDITSQQGFPWSVQWPTQPE